MGGGERTVFLCFMQTTLDQQGHGPGPGGAQGPGGFPVYINPCTKETWKCAGGRGGKGLAYRRQKVDHRKGGLRRRTDLSMCRGADAAQRRRGCAHARHALEESPQRL